MKEINNWKPKSGGVQALLNENIIPVTDEHGRRILLKPKDTFAIMDRQKYGAMFAGKVATLAIPLDELRTVRTLLSALELDNRYVSRLVNETSKVENAVRDAALTRDFRQRAYSLLRYAFYII